MRARTVQGIAFWLFCTASQSGEMSPAAACESPPQPGQYAEQAASGEGALTGSQASSVRDIENQAISKSLSREGTPSGPGAAFPTGRMQYNWHDAYASAPSASWPAYKSETAQESAIGSVYYKFPRSILGASVQAGAFGGASWATTIFKPAGSAHGQLSANKLANLSELGGAYVLVNFGNSYVMNTAAGFIGTMDQRGYGIASGSYGTHGFADTAVAGHVLAPLGEASPFRLDVRAGAIYSNASGGSFTSTIGEVFRPSAEDWTGSFSLMLFRDFELSTGTFRPFVKASLKEQIAASNKVEDRLNGNATTYTFRETPTLAGAEAGFDYTMARVTISGAVHGEAGADQTSVGGRLGAKFAF